MALLSLSAGLLTVLLDQATTIRVINRTGGNTAQVWFPDIDGAARPTDQSLESFRQIPTGGSELFAFPTNVIKSVSVYSASTATVDVYTVSRGRR